ncbi:hypothetical protein PG984_008579 [Apiospora sp. TS-2023a]
MEGPAAATPGGSAVKIFVDLLLLPSFETQTDLGLGVPNSGAAEAPRTTTHAQLGSVIYVLRPT